MYQAKIKAYKLIDYFTINLYIDCFDENNSWRVAKIVDIINNDSIKVVFDGWSHKWDEVIFIQNINYKVLF